MIDRGLLLSIGMIVVALWLAGRWAPPRTMARDALFEVLAGPVFVGGLIGRLTAMLLADPTALSHPRDLLIIRSGVELWPALAIGGAIAWRRARREMFDPVVRLSDLAPYVLVGMGTYDATCLFREGCFGPASPVGLVPPGLATSVFPLGLLTGVLTIGAAAAVRRLSPTTPTLALALAVAFVATLRSIVSFWLPRFGDELTRQHRESIVVAAMSLITLFATVGRRLRTADTQPR